MRSARGKRRMLALGDVNGELEAAVPHVLQYGIMPTQAQLLEAGRPDLAQAVRVRRPPACTASGSIVARDWSPRQRL